MTQKILIAVFVLLVCWLEYINYNKTQDFQTKLEYDYAQKRVLLERQLEAAGRERLALVHRFDSLHNLVESTTRANLKLDSLLSKVKGSYKDRTPTELEKEMIKRFNENQ